MSYVHMMDGSTDLLQAGYHAFQTGYFPVFPSHGNVFFIRRDLDYVSIQAPFPL